MTSRRALYAAGEPFGDSATRIEGHRMILGGGGGSSAPKNYKNLEALYGEQTASARLLRNQAERNLPGAVNSYMAATNQYLAPGYAEKQAGMAASDMGAANAMERAATSRDMASMGVNPNDPRFAGSMRSTEMNNAARLAAGKNIARNDALGTQLAVAKDAVGTFTGQSNMAAQQMGNASSGMANLASQQQQAEIQKQNQRSQNISNAVGGGMAAWSMLKDGGKVKMIERHMLGGGAGSQQQKGMLSVDVQAPPPMQQQQQPQQQQRGPSLQDMIKTGQEWKKEGTIGERMTQRGAAQTEKMGRVANMFSEQGGRNMYGQAAGQRMGEQAGAARDAYTAAAQQATDPKMAQQYMDMAANISDGAGLGSTVSTAAGTTGTTGAGIGGAAVPGASNAVAGAVGGAGGMSVAPGASSIAAGLGAPGSIAGGMSTAGSVAGAGAAAGSTAAAGTTAALTGTASAGAGAMATVGAALPWVGAAIGVGSLLGLFKDGGKVGNYDDGARVPGEWQGNTDTVPALLTEEEHVINAEAAKMIGHGKLEQLNKRGLKEREKGKTPDRIRTIGLGALA